MCCLFTLLITCSEFLLNVVPRWSVQHSTVALQRTDKMQVLGMHIPVQQTQPHGQADHLCQCKSTKRPAPLLSSTLSALINLRQIRTEQHVLNSHQQSSTTDPVYFIICISTEFHYQQPPPHVYLQCFKEISNTKCPCW